MQLLADSIRAVLLENGARFGQDPDSDLVPVVKLFAPDGAATWLIASAQSGEPDVFCSDYAISGVGFSELGSVRLFEIEDISGLLVILVGRDIGFSPTKSISAYASEAARRRMVLA